MATGTCPDCHAEIPDREPAVTFCPACGSELVSVRPPDLRAGELPAESIDPLDGWDRRAAVSTDDPVGDAVVVAAGGAVGAVAGLVVARAGRRGRGGVVGALVGLGAGAAVRRIWELPAPDDAWAEALQR